MVLLESQRPISESGPNECVHAGTLVSQARAAHSQGRLDRTVRALVEAERLCSAEAPDAVWPLLVSTLAELGRRDEAVRVLGDMERHSKSEDAKLSAAGAKHEIERQTPHRPADVAERRAERAML